MSIYSTVKNISSQTISFIRKRSFLLLAIMTVLAGIYMRVKTYLFNRSLWLDEASLALNIVTRGFWNLLNPLDHNQGAPVGFLLATKLDFIPYLLTTFGNFVFITTHRRS